MRCCGCKEVVPGCCQERFLQTPTPGKSLHAVANYVLATAETVFLQHVIARSVATWQSVLLAAQHRRKQYFGRIRKNATNSPKHQPICQAFLRGRGLPHQCAHWLAMTCKRRVRVSECKAVGREGKCVDGGSFAWYNVLAYADTPHVSACHCEERSDVAIRFPAEILGKPVVLGANPQKLQIRLKCCYLFCVTARKTDCHASVRTGSQ